ncbi:MAG: DNA helicase, partial [Thermomicrobiales bacterium]
FEDIADNFAVALDEFITIERHLKLGAWKHDRAISPERRVLAGTSMLARYHEEDQSPDFAEYNRALVAWEQLTDEEKKSQAKPSGPKGPHAVRLRIDLADVASTTDDALSLWETGPGASVVISPRWKTDSRLPEAQRAPFTPTVRQLLPAAGGDIVAFGMDKAADGTFHHYLDVTVGGFGTKNSEFAFNQPFRGFEPNGRLTIDASPNDWYSSFQRNVVSGLRAGKRNALFDLLTERGPATREPDAAAVDGQARFMEGLRQFQAVGALPAFEASKQQLIGGLAESPALLVQGPPGTGKSLTAAYAILARIQGAMNAGRDCRVIMTCKTHAAVDELLRKVVEVLDRFVALRRTHPALWDAWFDPRLLELPLFRFEPKHEQPPDGVIVLGREAKGDARPQKQIDAAGWCVVATALAGVDRMAKLRAQRASEIFGFRYCDLLVLDEASQINLPEAIMGALALKDDGQLIVIGDHRQMPPIVQNDWEREVRRTFVAFKSYESLFLTLREKLHEAHQIRFEESFRVHADIAEFLRKEIYQQDKIAFFSRRTDVLPCIAAADAFVAAVLHPQHPLTVVVHEEVASQKRNPYEQELMSPVLETLASAGFTAQTGLGVVVPHTAQRAALRDGIPALTELDPDTGAILRSAVDTVERFQGAERTAIVVGATESDPLYLLANSSFLFDPRRLNVAISRAKQKLILVSSRSIFDVFATDEAVFVNAQLWKNLLEETCTVPLWEGERHGHRVQVWGNVPRTE